MKLWFKAKRYGWGWFPATWQGWLTLTIYFIIVAYQLIAIEMYTLSPRAIADIAVPRIVALTIILIAICFMTGERPGWHWGNKK